MSHIVTVKTALANKRRVVASCEALKLPTPVEGVHQVYTRKVEGLGVKLPKWHYPVVVGNDGETTYDNSLGHWGDIARLHELEAKYAEITTLEAYAQVPYLHMDRQETAEDVILTLTLA